MSYGLEVDPVTETTVACPCCGYELEVILTAYEVDPNGPCECRLFLEGLGEGQRYMDALRKALGMD